jgi:hypothetical protein
MNSTQKMLLGAASVIALGVVVYLARGPDTSAPLPHAPSATATATATVSAAPTVTAPAPTASTAEIPRGDAATVTTGQPVDLSTALAQTKTLVAAKEALDAGDARRALKEIEAYERFPSPRVNQEEATFLKIQILPRVGRRTDSLALAISTRDDPAMAPYQSRILAFTIDAGLTPPPPP